MPRLTRQRSSAAKQVICTHCGRPSEVGGRAMSVVCPHCHKRLILEDFKIRGYHGVTEFATCGDILVQKSGHVVAPIKVTTLTVRGSVQGSVLARGAVTVGKTGTLKGDVEAPSLVVEKGGVYCGYLTIRPNLHSEDQTGEG